MPWKSGTKPDLSGHPLLHKNNNQSSDRLIPPLWGVSRWGLSPPPATSGGATDKGIESQFFFCVGWPKKEKRLQVYGVSPTNQPPTPPGLATYS